MGLTLKSSGSFKNTEGFLKRNIKGDPFRNLSTYGQAGVDALSSATPQKTGLTASSWQYRIINDHKGPRLEWYNTNVNDGVIVAIILQYGHGTGTGGYVEGIDYINPAIIPIFEAIAQDVWREVTL